MEQAPDNCIFAFNILISALISLLGVICEDFVLVEVDSISVKYKVMLIIIYMLVFKITQMPDSVFIKFSSKNADILENSELGSNIQILPLDSF